MNVNVPAARAWPDCPPEFYRFFLKVAANSTDNGTLTNIDQRLTAVEKAGKQQVQGFDSIQTEGGPTGYLYVTLQGDVSTPGNTQYYGTDTTGERGWFNVSDALGAASLADLGDVATTAPTDKYVLTWDAATSKWIPAISSGLPAGGTTGQVLTKASATDGDATWTDPSGGVSFQPGAGLAMDTGTSPPTLNSTLGSIALRGRKADYASLPVSGNTAGDAYLLDSDGLVYVWDAVGGWPASGAGIDVAAGPKLTLPAGIDNLLWQRASVYPNFPRDFTSSNTAGPQRLVDGSSTTTPYLKTLDSPSPPDPAVTLVLPVALWFNKVTVWHYYQDGRKYHGTKTEISADGKNWSTIFDSAISGEYAETSTGHAISFAAQYVRFIRDKANGSTANTGTHWVQIAAYYI